MLLRVVLLLLFVGCIALSLNTQANYPADHAARANAATFVILLTVIGWGSLLAFVVLLQAQAQAEV